MKKKIIVKKIIYSFSVCMLALMLISNINAASIGMSINKSSAYIGDSFSVTISGINGKVNITSSSNVSISTSGTQFIDGSMTINGTANSVGAASVTVTPIDVTTTAAEPEEVTQAKTVSLTVKEKEVVNNTNNTNNNASNNTTANTQASTSNNTSTKSSNNYLKSLQVSEEGLSPNFNKNKTSYSLSVSEKVTSINVTALAEDSNAKVYVSGNTDLKDGDNNVYITVTAQNGSKRTYTIVVNKSADPQKANSYLTNLIIKDMILSPEFSNEVLEYDGGTMKMSEDKLDIYAYPENENAKVEIIGSENLVDGENTVTIKVTSEDGTSTKEYVIKFVKETVEEVQALENEETKMEDTSNWFKTIFKDLWNKIKQNALILLMYLFVIVEFVQIVYLYNKVKKKDQEIARLKSLNLENTDNVNSNEEELTLLSESFKLPELENSNENEELSDFIEENIEETENVNNVENIDNENLNLSDEKEVIEESNEDDTQSQIDNMVKSIWDEDDRLRFTDDFNDETSSRSRHGKI